MERADVMDASLETPELDKLNALLRGAPLHREIYVRLLELCKERRQLSDVEDAVRSWPQARQVAQSPYRLVRDLVDEGGLDWIELDEDGLAITAERTEGLDAEKAQDLVASYAVETTALGADAAERWSPRRRLDDLVHSVPGRTDALAEVLSFCSAPQQFCDVEELLGRLGFLDTLHAENGRPLKASYFVDVLERAGGLEWDGAWHTTEAGREALERMLQG